MHLKDAKTSAKATKIRILQMPHPGDNITEGYALRATPPATSLRLMPSASLLSEAPRCHLPQQERRSERTNARAKRVARSRGLSEAQPSVIDSLRKASGRCENRCHSNKNSHPSDAFHMDNRQPRVTPFGLHPRLRASG